SATRPGACGQLSAPRPHIHTCVHASYMHACMYARSTKGGAGGVSRPTATSDKTASPEPNPLRDNHTRASSRTHSTIAARSCGSEPTFTSRLKLYGGSGIRTHAGLLGPTP